MTYSVWNHADRVYDYYRTAKRSAASSSPHPSHLRASTAGVAPSDAAWPLPAHAKRVGRGTSAKGFIASHRRTGLGALPFDVTGPNLIVFGIIAFLAYQHWWKPTQKARA